MKKLIITSVIILSLCVAVIAIYPSIEFKKDGKLYACRFSYDFSEFEDNASYNELYFYNQKHDVSLKNFNAKNFLCFYVLSFEYVDGDVRKTQFLLEESYIENWLENAEIEQNDCNLDLGEIIKNKTAIVGNTRYFGNDYSSSITYKLDGKWETLYVFESDGLIVIQVGSADELPKFIAYK